jgi:hypothetical protein
MIPIQNWNDIYNIIGVDEQRSSTNSINLQGYHTIKNLYQVSNNMTLFFVTYCSWWSMLIYDFYLLDAF